MAQVKLGSVMPSRILSSTVVFQASSLVRRSYSRAASALPRQRVRSDHEAQFLLVAFVLGRGQLGQELVLARRLEALVARNEAVDRSPRSDGVLLDQRQLGVASDAQACRDGRIQT